MLPTPWKIISSKKDDRYQIFTLRTDRACSPRTGEEHDFYIVESPPWVNVIPLISDNDVFLIHQYRHALVIAAFYRFFMEYIPYVSK